MNILNQTQTTTFDGNIQDARAATLAAAIGHKLDGDFSVIAKAKQDWEGGPFRVMFTVMSGMTKEQIDELPDSLDTTGNNPRFYKSRIKTADGKDTTKEHDFYKILAESLPGLVSKKQRIDMLELSMKDPMKFNLSSVPDDVMNTKHHVRHAEISKLKGEISTGKAAVVKAFELYCQFRRFATLQGVTAAILYAVDADGKELNGEAGRAIQVENTRTPIILRTKLEARRDLDFSCVSIGAFLKFPVAHIREQGGSWQAMIDSVKKGTKEKDADGKANAVNIETVDTAERVMNDFAEYLYRIQDSKTPQGKSKAEWQALEKAVKGAGSDDNFYNARLIFESLRLLVGGPKDDVRWQKLFADREEAAAA